MSTSTEAPAPAATAPPPQQPAGHTSLVRGELLKISTTNTWWILLIGAFSATAVALLTWILVGNSQIDDAEAAGERTFEPPEGAPDAQVDIMREQFERSQDITRTLHDVAAEVYTSGQYFGLLVALVLGTLLVTNEYYHQTATATFLTTPRRTRVIVAKLQVAMVAGGFFWLFSLLISIAAGATFLAIKGYGPQLGEWPVLRAILLNGLAYGLWSVVGIGLGTILRSQIGAMLTALLVYVIGGFLVDTVASLLYILLDWRWIYDVVVFWPGVASQVMISPEPPIPDSPAWWVGALILLGYGLLFGTIGVLITRKRDIS